MSFTKQDIISAIRTVYDPEIPVNIWDLGLIYDIDIRIDSVYIKMTFTSPTCPMTDQIMNELRTAVTGVIGDIKLDIELVWEPKWDISKMSDEAKLEFDLTESGW